MRTFLAYLVDCYLCTTHTCDLLASPVSIEESEQKTEQASKAVANIHRYTPFSKKLSFQILLLVIHVQIHWPQLTSARLCWCNCAACMYNLVHKQISAKFYGNTSHLVTILMSWLISHIHFCIVIVTRHFTFFFSY